MTYTEKANVSPEVFFTVEGEIEGASRQHDDCPAHDAFVGSFAILDMEVNGVDVTAGIDMQNPEIVKLFAAIERAVAKDAEGELMRGFE